MKNNIVIQRISGGLGNQMFQYAYIKALSLRNNVDFGLDTWRVNYYHKYWNFWPYQIDKIFNIDNKLVNLKDIPFYERTYKLFYGKSLGRLPYSCHTGVKLLCSFLNLNDYRESFFNPLLFNAKFLTINSGYISGNFMSEKYFVDYWPEIEKDFSFKKDISKKTNDLLKFIMTHNCVSVHVRRGDYLNNSNIYPIINDGYYKKAIDILSEKIKNLYIIFFSDDIVYVRKKFQNSYENSIFVDFNDGENSWQDMLLMSSCKHNITAHSTFSRWGAYLNKNPKKIVVTPQKWFKDGSKYSNNSIIPDNRFTLPID